MGVFVIYVTLVGICEVGKESNRFKQIDEKDGAKVSIMSQIM
ncbi:hypothetical protein JCM19233_170 [Vibrio astriarenae]|nr:hypothetical protein JCM19233_170 [Vibrio sp. C7]